MNKYPHVFREGQIGRLTVRNRIVMAPMGTLLAEPGGAVSDHQIAYYAERARGGTGLIVTEIFAVEPELGKAVAIQARADDDRFIPGISRLAAASQKYGARIFPQLHHAGIQSNSRVCGGKQIVGPSEVSSNAVGETPRALTGEEVRELVQAFIAAAVRCRIAGCDGIELHGAHGYLINQFSSPHTNRREDEYGGSFENRMRFFTEILLGIKAECGKDFPVMARYSAEEFVDGGITLDEGIAIGRHLAQHGVDALHVSCGTYESMPTLLEPIMYEQGWRVNMAEAVKQAVNVPVVSVGVIRQPAFAEKVLAEGRADYVALGRSLLADADWANKAAANAEKQIRPCISCLYCVDRIFAPNHIACAVNARTGRELEFAGYPDDGAKRNIAIIGGGPAGMEAARVLALRDFRPVIYEKNNELGGELVRGCIPPGKDEIRWYKDYLIHQMHSLDVDVRLGIEMTPEKLKEENPYAVVVAVGAEPFVPDCIPGIPGNRVVTAWDALDGVVTADAGDTVAVIGGGMTGCEIADMLAERGLSVTVIEQLSTLVPDTNPINRAGIRMRLEKARVNILTGRRVLSVGKGVVEVEVNATDDRETVDADWVVLSLGFVPLKEQVDKWREVFPQAGVVGDAVDARRVAEAIRESYDVARSI